MKKIFKICCFPPGSSRGNEEDTGDEVEVDLEYETARALPNL